MLPTPLCPVYAPFLGALGCVACMALTCIGTAYGTAKSAVAIFHIGVTRPDLVMKMLLPVLMAGIIGLLGMVISLFLTLQLSQSNFSLYLGSIFLGAGLCMGVCGLSAGICIGILTDAGIRAYAQQPKLFTILIIMLIFAEVLTIYGFIISILLIFRGSAQQC